jgi:hypothetical protein
MCAFEKKNTSKPLIRGAKMFLVIPLGQNGATHHEASCTMHIVFETIVFLLFWAATSFWNFSLSLESFVGEK